ncbi:MAG: hypothetical protein KF812_09235 [Fimbriimonadaceae bacterium]|nr:hypothetical protein [Fimbriimonadaceae bacterium]
MKLIRSIYVLLTAIGIGSGYAVSQQHFFTGTTAAYTEWIDRSIVPVAALVWLVAGLGLSLIPDKNPPEVTE